MELKERMYDLCWWLQINTLADLNRFKKEYCLERATDEEIVAALQNEFNEVWG